MMKQTPRVLADKIDNATWDQHRETIHRLFILQNRKLEGPEGVMQVMSKVHGFSATKPQYEARFRSWNIRKKITEREWVSIVLHVHARAQQGRKTQVMFNGTVLDEDRVAREINRRLSRYNGHLNNLQELPKVPPGFKLQSPSSAAVPYADNAISDHNPTSCLKDLDIHTAVLYVCGLWLIDRHNPQMRLPLFTIGSSDTIWKHLIVQERYGKQKQSMPWNYFRKSLGFYPSCMHDYAYEYVADELGNMGPGQHSIRWFLSFESYQPSSFKDRYDNGFVWEIDGIVILRHKSWHCNDCSNHQSPSPVLNQCDQCGSADGILLEQKIKRLVRLKLVIPEALLNVKKRRAGN